MWLRTEYITNLQGSPKSGLQNWAFTLQTMNWRFKMFLINSPFHKDNVRYLFSILVTHDFRNAILHDKNQCVNYVRAIKRMQHKAAWTRNKYWFFSSNAAYWQQNSGNVDYCFYVTGYYWAFCRVFLKTQIEMDQF